METEEIKKVYTFTKDDWYYCYLLYSGELPKDKFMICKLSNIKLPENEEGKSPCLYNPMFDGKLFNSLDSVNRFMQKKCLFCDSVRVIATSYQTS